MSQSVARSKKPKKQKPKPFRFDARLDEDQKTLSDRRRIFGSDDPITLTSLDAVARDHIPGFATFKRRLQERRNRAGVEKAFQKAIGFDTKVRQYDMGERFVAEVVGRVGMSGFNRVWEQASNLPTLEEVGRPEAWVARVAAAS